MKEDIVKFKTAILLNEIGFDGHCNRFYQYNKNDIDGNKAALMFASDINGFCYVTDSLLQRYNKSEDNVILAPTKSFTMKWLRDTFNIFIIITPYIIDFSGRLVYKYEIKQLETETNKLAFKYSEACYDSYEETMEAAIQYCLNNLIKRNNI